MQQQQSPLFLPSAPQFAPPPVGYYDASAPPQHPPPQHLPPPHLQWKRLESSSLQLPSIKMAMIWLIRGPAAAAAASLSHIAASS